MRVFIMADKVASSLFIVENVCQGGGRWYSSMRPYTPV